MEELTVKEKALCVAIARVLGAEGEPLELAKKIEAFYEETCEALRTNTPPNSIAFGTRSF